LAEATMMDEAHHALVRGAKALAFMAIEVMMDEKLRSSIREAFEKEKQA
ncbi:MAG TPA: amidohydrolase, partial [Thermovirga lienii]|nr:amidohydrolase [Thermovirga lienii]